MKHLLIPALLGAVAAAGSVRAATPAGAAGARPNVLFIAIDDLRPSLGCYGDPLAKTPHIDRLAGSARLFERAYTQQAVCGPSRAATFTGRLPDHNRVWHNRNLFRDTNPDTVTLPQLFKNHGYHAQGMGKIFSGDEREEDPASWSVPAVLRAPGWKNYVLAASQSGAGKGEAFERPDVPDDAYPDGKLAQLAVDTLGALKQKGQPFFLAVGFFKPHLPFNAPKKYWDLYDPAIFANVPPRPRPSGAPAVAYPDHLELAGYRNIARDERVSPEQARDLRHGYYACVSYVDTQVGRLLGALDRLGLAHNTIVVLWGDHGYSLAEADRWCKSTNFEADTRIPLMIRSPGLRQPGVATAAIVETVDLYPTLAQLAGLPGPAYLAGRSLVPLLGNPRERGREFALSQFARPFKPGAPEVMGYSIRTDTHRYTRWLDWATRRVIAEELYDYTSPQSAERRPMMFVERASVVFEPGYAELRERLGRQMDQVLRERSVVAEPDPRRDGEPKQPRKKKQR